MNSAQVSIFKKGNKVSLSSFLESEDGLALESDLLFELSRNLTNQSLEGKFSDEQISLNEERRLKKTSIKTIEGSKNSYTLLEFSDLSEGDRSRFESVGFLHAGNDGG
jgi:hypothetical protein